MALAVDALVEDKGKASTAPLELCFICSEAIQFTALTKCLHSTCHVCCLRLRSLYKKNSCTFCNQTLDKVIFARDPQATYADFDIDHDTSILDHISAKKKLTCVDKRLGIWYEDLEVMEESTALLRYNCPECNLVCDPVPGRDRFDEMQKHARKVHQKSMCDLCLKNLKIFTHEHVLYTQQELKRHMDQGEGATGFTGHPMCQFCRRPFFDSDALFKHCREKHEQCFICLANGKSDKWQYYRNYPALEQHFEQDHYSCPDPMCREKKFIVFETAFELQKHELEEHEEAMGSNGKKALKQARRLDTNFTYSSSNATASSSRPPQASTSNSNNNRIRSMNVAETRAATAAANPTPNFSEPSPASNTTRPRLVPGAATPAKLNKKGKAPFSGTLTPSTPQGATTPSSGAEGNSKIDGDTLSKHAELMRKVEDATRDSSNKTLAFKAAVKSYRQSETPVTDLLDTLYNLFDRRMNVMGSILLETADLMDNNEKREEILSAWLDFDGEETDFPSLAPLAPHLDGVPVQISKKVKHTESSQGNPQIWARVQQAAARTTSSSIGNQRHVPGMPTVRNHVDAFPALPAAVLPKSAKSKTAWSSSGATVTQTKPALPPKVQSIDPLASRTTLKASNQQEFPDLPSSKALAASRAATKELFSSPSTRPSFTWGKSPSGEDVPQLPEAESSAQSNKRKKQSKKQILFVL